MPPVSETEYKKVIAGQEAQVKIVQENLKVLAQKEGKPLPPQAVAEAEMNTQLTTTPVQPMPRKNLLRRVGDFFRRVF